MRSRFSENLPVSQYLQTPPPHPGVPPQGYPPAPQRHGLAMPSLVLGVLGILFFPFGILALIFGFRTLSGIKTSLG